MHRQQLATSLTTKTTKMLPPSTTESVFQDYPFAQDDQTLDYTRQIGTWPVEYSSVQRQHDHQRLLESTPAITPIIAQEDILANITYSSAPKIHDAWLKQTSVLKSRAEFAGTSFNPRNDGVVYDLAQQRRLHAMETERCLPLSTTSALRGTFESRPRPSDGINNTSRRAAVISQHNLQMSVNGVDGSHERDLKEDDGNADSTAQSATNRDPPNVTSLTFDGRSAQYPPPRRYN